MTWKLGTPREETFKLGLLDHQNSAFLMFHWFSRFLIIGKNTKGPRTCSYLDSSPFSRSFGSKSERWWAWAQGVSPGSLYPKMFSIWLLLLRALRLNAIDSILGLPLRPCPAGCSGAPVGSKGPAMTDSTEDQFPGP